ncbi:hypothetical protein GCM10022419_101330 [Nonomuraea rosea]|uniref:Uncharacterized protein n=1 Tax=Nonomuraea rosea TaxID=638574 RepID=A0ABP6Z893_9ACTN
MAEWSPKSAAGVYAFNGSVFELGQAAEGTHRGTGRRQAGGATENRVISHLAAA